MGYVPVKESQDFDIIMYYTVDDFWATVRPTHWGMMRGGQVISKNITDDYVMRHDVDAIVKDVDSVEGATHVMYFRKTDS